MGSYQTTVDITILQSYNTDHSPDMQFKYLIILASFIAVASADARIVFQQEFVPRNHVDVEPETITLTTTSTPITSPTMMTTIIMTREEELTPLCGGSEDWCSSPADYPDEAILAAALRQNNSLSSLFDSKLLVKEKEVPTENSVQSRKGFPEFEEFVEEDMVNTC